MHCLAGLLAVWPACWLRHQCVQCVWCLELLHLLRTLFFLWSCTLALLLNLGPSLDLSRSPKSTQCDIQNGLQASLAKLKTAFVPAAVSGTLYWPVVNLVTFSLPPSRRIAFLGISGIAWNSLLSYLNSSQSQADDLKK